MVRRRWDGLPSAHAFTAFPSAELWNYSVPVQKRSNRKDTVCFLSSGKWFCRRLAGRHYPITPQGIFLEKNNRIKNFSYFVYKIHNMRKIIYFFLVLFFLGVQMHAQDNLMAQRLGNFKSFKQQSHGVLIRTANAWVKIDAYRATVVRI